MKIRPWGGALLAACALFTNCATLLGIDDAKLADEGAGTGGGAGAGAGGEGATGGGGTAAQGDGGSGGSSSAAGGSGGGGNAGGQGPTDGGEAGSGPEQPPLCETYCDTVMDACQGDNAIYASLQVCLNLCEILDEGAPGEAGNTVNCRLEQAQFAKETLEPEDHCPYAGLGGAGRCGENCDGYCVAMLATCTDAFASMQDCLDACADVPDGGHNSAEIDSGDSIQCRLWHVGAATIAVDPHCKHAAGASPCQ